MTHLIFYPFDNVYNQGMSNKTSPSIFRFLASYKNHRCFSVAHLRWRGQMNRNKHVLRVHTHTHTHTHPCQGALWLIFMHSVTSSLPALLNILFPWAFQCCLVSEINMYEPCRWEFLIDLHGPALLFNICLGLLVPAQWQ